MSSESAASGGGSAPQTGPTAPTCVPSRFSLRHAAVRAALTLGVLGTVARRAEGQAGTVPLDDPAYRIVDALLARSLVPGAIVGQRPYSRRELARLARAFAAAVPRDPRSAALVALLLEAAGDTTRNRPVDAGYVSLVATDEAPRAIPSNGLGGIDATTVPPLDGRGGRPIVRGAVTSIETSHGLDIGRHLALAARPRVSLLAPSDGATRLSLGTQQLVARGVWRNAALQAGADPVTLGQGGARGLLLGTNAEPLHAIVLSTDTAVVLPWVLRRVGRVRAIALVADLGRGQSFPHAKLAGYKISATPSARLELGAGLFSQFGGHGAPPLSLTDRLLDLVPYLTWLHPSSGASRDKYASNKLASVDVALRVPELAGLTIGYELELDDFDLRRARSTFWEDGAHLLDVRLDRLTNDGTLALDVVLRHAPLRIGEHPQFTSGVTYHGHLLGDPLGPNGGAADVALRWRPAPLTELAVRATSERRDASHYVATFIDAAERDFRLVRTSTLPVERRRRLTLVADRSALHGIGLSARVGTERVTNEAFVVRAARWHGFADAGLVLRW